MIPEFAKVDTLPGTQIQAPVCDGNGKTLAEKRCFYMRGHIIRPFTVMAVYRMIFRNKLVQEILKIGPYRRIGIFINGNGCRSMLYEYMQKSFIRQIWKGLLYDMGDEMISPGIRIKLYFLLYCHSLKFMLNVVIKFIPMYAMEFFKS